MTPQRRGLWQAVVVAWMVCLAPGRSLGADPRVVVIGPAADDMVRQRVSDELRALGFEVVEVVEASRHQAGAASEGASREDVARQELEHATQTQQAAFAMVISRSERGYDVWVRDRVTGKTLIREVLPSSERAAPTELALRAVELLRASLLELRARHEVRGDVEADQTLAQLADEGLHRPSSEQTPEQREPATLPERLPPPADSSRRVVGSTNVGACALVTGGFSPLWCLELGGRWMITPTVGMSGHARGSFAAGSLQEDRGEASMRLHQGGLSLHWSILPADALFAPFLEAGIGVAWVRLDAQTENAAYLAHPVDQVVATPAVSAGVSVGAPSFPLRARLGLGWGVMVPTLSVRFDQAEVAEVGLPLAALTVGAEYLFY